ncbi:CD276 antigen-like [Clupea harengus]|uniref:CD276 antigen-like n=1 Tax=Clupea harengus TaxID=7950 RepID=A0A8M1KSW6_CLUHA|nr:CD276 antigen-like [Clupea harengus]
MALESLLMVWILTSSEAFLLRGPAGPLIAQLGGSVLLPCSAETPLPLEELEVEWRRTDSEALVHLFQEGEVRPESQSYDYSGRAHFLTEGFVAGNYSLQLTNVTRADGGVYTCKVFTNLDSNEITAEIKDIERLVVTGTGVASAYVGDEVTLNCSVDSHIPPGELENVTWKKKDQEMLVLVFRYDQIVPVSAHELYRDRADLFTAEIPKGNFSLRLKHVRPEDKGEYVCEAHSGHLSANTIIALQGLGPPPVQILALVLCVIALLLALGLGVPSCIHLVSNVMPRRYPGYVGEEVVLSLDKEDLPGTIVSVTWKKKGQVILAFQDGKVLLASPESSYHGRTEFAGNPDEDEDEDEDGDEDGDGHFSLRLKNVETEDEGEYICEVHTSERSERSVALQVCKCPRYALTFLQ